MLEIFSRFFFGYLLTAFGVTCAFYLVALPWMNL